MGGAEECGGKGKLCARAFKHKKCIPEKKVFAAIGMWEGVRHVGGWRCVGQCWKWDSRVACVMCPHAPL